MLYIFFLYQCFVSDQCFIAKKCKYWVWPKTSCGFFIVQKNLDGLFGQPNINSCVGDMKARSLFQQLICLLFTALPNLLLRVEVHRISFACAACRSHRAWQMVNQSTTAPQHT